jgi:ERCC4-related helicase
VITDYHAKYFAYDLTRQSPAGAVDQLSKSLFDASVDLNPHQIEAAMFALQSPLSDGVVLADEVGLGKTIEAGIVLCQKWAEGKRRLLVLCPASIRKQWAIELAEKFNLPALVIDAKTYKNFQRQGIAKPFEQKAIIILSYHYAVRMQDEIRMITWDLVTIDEAHKLRNAYRPSNKMGQSIRWSTESRKKLLLTATPFQNSLMELYGLSTLIDDHLFGDPNSYRSKYVNAGGNLEELRQRISGICKRTLRKQVLEYVRYTERKALTQRFHPTDDELKLYNAVSKYLQKDDLYAIPARQRHLTVLILRKLLASSSHAIAGTLEGLKARLIALRDGQKSETDWGAEEIVETEEMEEELIEEWFNDSIGEEPEESSTPDAQRLKNELREVEQLVQWAHSIGTDTKTKALLKALNVGFREMEEKSAARKALIFTESRRTQDYLKAFLEANGYSGKVILFNGTNGGPEVKKIYDDWVARNIESGRVAGSRAVDSRTAIIEHFRDEATIMIATEAASEGVNLQFCSLVINYDLPWNPQRIEQRIGRCHRYGQKHDVIVINFLNERNEADQRVYELLNEKFSLFNGLFGASDEVLGTIESGVDFEKRILAIYQECRTSDEIDKAFNQLREELDEQIKGRLEETRRVLLEHFDEDVHARLKLQLQNAHDQLDRVGKRFWDITKLILNENAKFDDKELIFDLEMPPSGGISPGRYHLISKTKGDQKPPGEARDYGFYLYRLSHPLGEHVIESAKSSDTPVAELAFDVTHHSGRIAVVQELKGKSGYLVLNHLSILSYEEEEYLLFSGVLDNGKSLNPETCEKLFNCKASVIPSGAISNEMENRLTGESDQHMRATVNLSMESNSKHLNVARDRLEQWSEDKILAAEKILKDTKEQIKYLRREARQAQTLEEQHQIQEKLQKLERKQRKQRQEIFTVEDEIEAKRDSLIDALEKRLYQTHKQERLFTIRWKVV